MLVIFIEQMSYLGDFISIHVGGDVEPVQKRHDAYEHNGGKNKRAHFDTIDFILNPGCNNSHTKDKHC